LKQPQQQGERVDSTFAVDDLTVVDTTRRHSRERNLADGLDIGKVTGKLAAVQKGGQKAGAASAQKTAVSDDTAGSGRGIRTDSVQPFVDPRSGKEYFYNTHTQITGWTADEVSRKAVVPPWTAHIDEDSGATYYYNSESGAKSWEAPAAPTTSKNGAKKVKKGKNESSCGANLNSGEESVSAALPAPAVVPPWTAHIDEDSGATYYYNSESGAKSWEAPAAPTTSILGVEQPLKNPLRTQDSSANRIANI
jgi:YHS domain-containing protein